MNVQALEQLLKTDAEVRLLDVRTTGEFESAHLAGAYNVPLHQLREHTAEFRRVESPVVLICQSGSRARQAEALLRQAGLQKLHLLEGGMSSWMSAGLPVLRGTRQRLPLERQVRILAGLLVALFSLLALQVPVLCWVSAAIGGGLVFAGVTDTCPMAMLLAKLPYNQSAACDPDKVVEAMTK